MLYMGLLSGVNLFFFFYGWRSPLIISLFEQSFRLCPPSSVRCVSVWRKKSSHSLGIVSGSLWENSFQTPLLCGAVTSIEKNGSSHPSPPHPCLTSSAAKRSVLSGARIPLVLLPRGFKWHEYGCDDDEPSDEGSLVFLQISANRIWRPWQRS